MKLRIRDLIEVLQKYEGRYRWLDVFASEVHELTESTDLNYKQVNEDQYHLLVDSQAVELVLDRPRNQARFRLIKEADLVSGAIVGASVGALVGVVLTTAARSHPAGILLALLVGGIIGAWAAEQSNDDEPPVDENRILTLAYEPENEHWGVYHGPYRDYAKVALHPSFAT